MTKKTLDATEVRNTIARSASWHGRAALQELFERTDFTEPDAVWSALTLAFLFGAQRRNLLSHGTPIELIEFLGTRPKAREVEDSPDSTSVQHPEHPELEWAGRGRRPLWLKELLDQGYDLEELRVSLTPTRV